MGNNIYIHKRGILLEKESVWVSLNDGKYKLYGSNPIQFSTTQKENTVKLKEVFFICSKKIDVQIEGGSVSLNIEITKLDRWLRAGIIIVSLFCILYIVCPFRFMPTQALFYILFGYWGIAIILPFIFKRKNYFKVQIFN